VNTNITNSLILFSLAEQVAGPLVTKHVCVYISLSLSIYTQWFPPAAGLRHSICVVGAPRSQSPQLLAAALPELLVQTVTLTCVRTHTHACTQIWLGLP